MIINAIWEHFSVECHKTKVNGQSEESKYLKGLMRIQSKNNCQSAGKRRRPSRDWFHYCIWLIDGVKWLQREVKEIHCHLGITDHSIEIAPTSLAEKQFYCQLIAFATRFYVLLLNTLHYCVY